MNTAGEAILAGTWEHDTPEWHAFRASVVASSDVATVLGLGYKSAYTLWHEKRGLVEPEQPDAKLRRKWAYGHHMEPFVAGIFEDTHPDLALAITGSWTHKVRTWQGCNPDRLVLDGGEATSVVELKTFPSLADWQDGPPPGYVAQLLWQVDTFGFAGGWLAGYANLSGDYQEYWYDANPFAAQATRETVKAFFDAEVPPEIDGSLSTYQTVRRLNPSLRRGEEVHIPQDVAEQYLEATAAGRAAEAELLKWKGHLLAHMGTAQYGIYEGKKIASRVAVKDGVPYLKEQ
jgi:hypothetical protein